MHFQRIYLDCLAQASYLIGDSGTAAIVDPRRDVDVYLDRARELDLSIEHVIATHVHADFVAGLRELAERTGATIHMGRRFDGELPSEPFGDGDEIRFGSVTLRALETPGHTPESICVLVTDSDASDAPPKLLTGDTLFIGDVGRPDLVGSRGFSSQDMAAMMYQSLRDKILPLCDEVEVHPGHGAGSACGKNISCDSWSTIGRQRLQNWALADRPKDEFVRMLTMDLAPPPRYFAHAAALNRAGPILAGDLPELRALSPAELPAAADGAVLLDVRAFAAYGERHVAGSLNVGLDGNFASWCGSLIPPGQPIIVIAADESGAREARMRLARVGLDDVRGYLLAEDDGVLAAGRALGHLPQLSVQELHAQLAQHDGWQVVDVRRPGEYRAGHVPGAQHAPLDRLPVDGAVLDGFDRARPTAVICERGYRSSAACRYLRELGFEDLHNVAGGTGAWIAAGFAVEK